MDTYADYCQRAEEEQRRWEEEERRNPRVGIARFADDPEFGDLLAAHRMEGEGPRAGAAGVASTPSPLREADPPSAPQPAKDLYLGHYTFTPFDMDGPEPEEDWIVEELLASGTVVLLAGRPKTGKSVMASALAHAVATGTPFLHGRGRAGLVLWVAEESKRERTVAMRRVAQAREEAYGVPTQTPRHHQHQGGAGARGIYTTYSRPNLTSQEHREEFVKLLSELRPRLVVLDSVAACCGRARLSDSGVARDLIEELAWYADTFRMAVVALHQVRDARDGMAVASSVQLAAAASGHWVLTSAPLGEGETGRRFRLARWGRGDWANGSADLLSSAPGLYEAAELPTRTELPTQREIVLASLDDTPRSAAEIAAGVELPRGSVQNLLTQLRCAGIVEGRREGREYRYTAG